MVLVGIELGGLMRTEDGGASFSDHRPGAARRRPQLGDGGDNWSELGDRIGTITALVVS